MKTQASISGLGLIVISIKWQASHGGPGLIGGVNQSQACLCVSGPIIVSIKKQVARVHWPDHCVD